MPNPLGIPLQRPQAGADNAELSGNAQHDVTRTRPKAIDAKSEAKSTSRPGLEFQEPKLGEYVDICDCGNGGHINLQEWYEELCEGNTSGLYSNRLQDDDLDLAVVAQDIEIIMPSIQISDGYCSNCGDFLTKLPELIGTHPGNSHTVRCSHFHSIAEFKASYKKGCRLCILFEEGIIQSDNAASFFNFFYKIENRFKCLGKPTILSVELQCRPHMFLASLVMNTATGDLDFPRLMTLMVVTDKKSTIQNPGRKYNLTQFELLREWITDCSRTHELCNKRPDNELPTRLLKITQNSVKLVLTANWRDNPRYATLSHCWGKVPFLKLITKSIDAFKLRVPEEELTKTFRDAISIVRTLGIDYLWIDSLCIVQDSLADWEVESGLMSSVYRGSVINIAAADAPDGSHGCFLESDPVIGKVRCESVSTGVAYEIANFPMPVHMTPLGLRAWVCQERLLAPRTVHFTKTEMIWKCRQASAREFFPDFIKQQGTDQVISLTWIEIVSEYTWANLTYSSDKLVAIAGIARAVHEERREQYGEYVAGLWRRNLEAQLCWYVERMPGRPHVAEAYRAPSWSWASTDGPIHYHYGLDADKDSIGATPHLHAHVVDVYVTPSGPDIFGPVSSGTITMSCSAMLSGRLSRGPFQISDSSFDSCEFVVLDGRTVLPADMVLIDSDPELGDDSTVYALPIRQSRWKMETQEGKEDKEEVRTYGLILAATNKKGEHSRVGYFYLFTPTSDALHQDTADKFFELLQECGAGTAKAACAQVLAEPKYPDERYIITIV